LNYRHAFHAGNFADLIKHATLLELLRALRSDRAPLCVIDTHAGAGAYDIQGETAKRSGEAQAGVARLMAAGDLPPALARLKAEVARANPAGGAGLYPGSPRLVAAGLRPGDRYIACELRDDDIAILRGTVGAAPGVEVLQADGYEIAAARAGARERLLVLMDPPYERADDYANLARTLAAVRQKSPASAVAIWLPIKDLETFDAFLRSIDGFAQGALVAEVRLRPLIDPMKMNGCAMVVLGGPLSVESPVKAACDWIVGALGDPGGQARVWRLGI
jgi:23S rRNA (adenine2030-N6)-methyltransferase